MWSTLNGRFQMKSFDQLYFNQHQQQQQQQQHGSSF
jgi:hypothetical protein